MRHLLLLTIIYHNSCIADGVVHDTVTVEGSRSQRSFVDKSCKIVDGMCLRTLLDLRGEADQFRGPNGTLAKVEPV
jgi:hypothetical protein